jgi:hypothetical protein
VGFIKNDTTAKKTHQLSEVSKIEWKNYNDVMKCIREYNIEKKNIVNTTKQILDTYEICG